MNSPRGHPRQVGTSWHFCPHPHCASRGWLGLGNISVNGHPNGGPWRQQHCTSCGGSFQETHGTPLHGTRVAPEKLVWAVGALAAAQATHSNVMVAGVAGLVAGAMSMAAGEYVSVHSQADTEQAELARERTELHADATGEHEELMAIYVGRGLDPALADQVAAQLMAHDALGAHARDELGITETLRARPVQAALASACSFAVGAALPLLVTALAPEAHLIPFVSGSSLVCLALLGGVAARVGGARVTVGALRVTFWGALAMGLTAGVGALFGTGA